MSEPKHWLDESSDADDFERAVLRSGSLEAPSRSVEQEVWSKILLAVSAASLVATTTAHSTALKTASGGVKAGSIWLGVSKGFVAGLALYGAAAGVNALSTRWQTPRRDASSAAQVAATAHNAQLRPFVPIGVASTKGVTEPTSALDVPSAATVAHRASLALSSAQEHVPAPASAAPPVATFEDAPSNSERVNEQRKSQLKAEASALREARAQLRAGQLSNAFATLEASRREFPVPELDQEREALMIELLFRSGQKDAAAVRAKAFLKQFPDSPHGDQIKQFALPH